MGRRSGERMRMYVDPFPGVLSIEKASLWRNNNIFRSPEEVRGCGAGSIGSRHILSQRKKGLRESQRGAGFITFTSAVIGNRRRPGMGFRTPIVVVNEALSCDSRFSARNCVKLSELSGSLHSAARPIRLQSATVPRNRSIQTRSEI